MSTETETPEEPQNISSKADDAQPSEEKSKASCYKDDQNVVLREDMKSLLQKFGTVKFIDFKIGAESGYVRFEEAEGAQKARAAAVLAAEGGLKVKNFIATLDPVTGEAEKEYWNVLRMNQDKHRDGFKSNSNRGRGGKRQRGGGGGRHFGRKNDSGRSNKFQKVAAA
ncbi:hypothetical protein M569_16911 [Genlisea aurea]|uniref:XRRM domain-containing protein n=1 Tax=Genlisea aurea TaxID=192259 RepID=S8C0H4_9LAMI|nr:hypothetical protein M569_16911 [Genlisea aurea]